MFVIQTTIQRNSEAAVTYKKAMKILKSKKENAGVLEWDSGDGWKARAYYCQRRRRIIQHSINPDGMLIV